MPTLARVADALLGEPTPLIDAMRSESRLWNSTLDEVFSDLPKALKDLAGSDDDGRLAGLLQQAGALSSADKQTLEKSVASALQGRLDGILAILRGPEKGWIEDQPEAPTPDNLQDYLTQAVVPTTAAAMNRAAVDRTKLRLLRLHGAVIAFLWEHHRLPKDLKELDDKSITDDPIVGEPFHYEITGGQAYKLWSAGWKDTGRIELKYQGARGGDGGPAVP